MYYSQELLNMNNPEEYKFALEMLYICSKPKDPQIVMLYNKEFGVHSKEDERELNWAKVQINVVNSCIECLEDKLKNISLDVDEIVCKIPGDCYYPYIKAVKKGSENKPKKEKKMVYV